MFKKGVKKKKRKKKKESLKPISMAYLEINIIKKSIKSIKIWYK